MKTSLNFLFSILLISLIASCSSNGSGNEKKYRDAVKNGDFEAAHEILDNMYDEFMDIYESNYPNPSSSDRAKVEAAATKYAQAASFVLCAEVRYLISENNDMAIDRIAYLFNEIRIMGEPASSYHPGGVAKLQQECIKYTCYNQTSIYNNQLCDVVLNLAIQNDNKKLADLAISYYRPNGIIVEDILHGEGDVVWEYRDKDAALKKYIEHFGQSTIVTDAEDKDDVVSEDNAE
jgi:hypothetical protein